MTRGARALVLIAVVLLGVALDQIVKVVAFGVLTSPVEIGGALQLRAIANKGAMLGMGSGLDEGARRMVFTIAEGALLAALAAYAVLARTLRALEVWAVALVVAGGASNVLDRIAFGYVRDYVLVGRPGWPTAAFNLADVAVVAGFAFFLVGAWRGARARPKAVAALLLLLFAGFAAPARATEARPFPLRMVKLGGKPSDPNVRSHVKYCRSIGFNAFFVYSHEAGSWADGPKIDPDFVKFAREMRAAGIELWLSFNPPADTRHRIVFSEVAWEQRAAAFIRKLHAKAHIDKFIVSFDDQPTQLTEFRDIMRYGISAAPAHLDLVARLAARMPAGTALWLCPGAYSDVHLGDGTGPYSAPFLAGLPKLPASVGIVWTGPEVCSRSITSADLQKTRARLGGRPLLLYDNFPVNDDPTGDALALILGALRKRDPAIRDEVAGYLACPMNELGGSRFSLSTTAAFLADPESYDPDRATAQALDTFSGGNKEARTALDTQVIEWGGWIGERNYWPRDLLNAFDAGRRLDDPAFVDSFTWTADRYPGRMLALAAIPDGPFREDLLMVMRRRLAVARAMPLVIEYLARMRAGRADAAQVLASIEQMRDDLTRVPDAHAVLDVFLRSAHVPIR